MINVQICLKTANAQTSTKFDLQVKSDDRIADLKDKIAAAQLIAFPEHSLRRGEETLESSKTLQDYGVKDNASLDFVILASEETIAKQLCDLLKTRDLTCDELGLLYCYKHGVSINQALKTVSSEEKLSDFIAAQKKFCVENGKISLVRDDTTLKPLSVSKMLEDLLREHGPTMEVLALCHKFVGKYHVSVANMSQMRPLDFLEKNKDTFTLLGNGMVTLKECETRERAKMSAQTTRAKSPYAQRERSRSRPKSVERSRPVTLTQQKSGENEQMYHDLHNKISSRSFNSRVSQILSSVASVIEEKSFLNIAEVAKGGSIAKGTACTDCCDGEVVLFVKGLPSEGHQKWMPALLRSVESVVCAHVVDASDVECLDDSVRMRVKNVATIHVRVSPAFESYSATVQALGTQGPGSRKMFDPSFVRERTQFVSKQPGNVKVTARLLKWWRDQQSWSCELTTPSDYLLELIAIYLGQQCGKLEQSQMIANCMSLMSKFDQLRVVWSNFYGRSDIWSPLFQQRPLLMDPVSPFTNVSAPEAFDPRELMALAATTHFFW